VISVTIASYGLIAWAVHLKLQKLGGGKDGWKNATLHTRNATPIYSTNITRHGTVFKRPNGDSKMPVRTAWTHSQNSEAGYVADQANSAHPSPIRSTSSSSKNNKKRYEGQRVYEHQTFTVPLDQGERVTVNTADCSNVCSWYPTSQERQCLRRNSDIPIWGTVWKSAVGEEPQDDEDGKGGQIFGDVYESYACLVCLNTAAMMSRWDNPEIGNDWRETQDVIDAVWSVSLEAGIPA
jgi:hypothetical protein